MDERERNMISDNIEYNDWSALEILTSQRKIVDLFDNVSFHSGKIDTLLNLLIRKLVSWTRDSLERLPIRLTLENVSVFAVILAILMPRAVTYVLVYPIFRLVFGTLYPAYASYKAVRTKNVKEYVKWMMYWIVFALFTCAETFTDVFFSFWFPFYYEIKIILVVWLLSPATKGSSILYRRFVHPALSRREAEIDEALARATEQGYTAVLQLGTKGVNYATTVLMQTAIKNLPSVMPSGSLAASQSDPAISSLAKRRTSPSLSETDGAGSRMTMTRRKARRRTRSEDIEVKGEMRKHVDLSKNIEPDDILNEFLNLDYDESGDTTNESIKLVDFKKPEPHIKRMKNREKSATRKKPRTRSHTNWNIDSDFSDEC